MIEMYIRKLYKKLQRMVKGKINIKYSSISGNLIIKVTHNGNTYVEELANIEDFISHGYSVELCARLFCQSYKADLLKKYFN